MADLVKLLQAFDDLWKAHEIAVLNGGGAWKRHVEPAIYELRKVQREFENSLQEHFKPPEPEEEEKITYAAGFYDGVSWGMFAGPTPNLEELLDAVPPFDEKRRPAYIIRFTGGEGLDGTWDTIRKWNNDVNNWVK